jgi:lipopolysaccharide biosynthesis regulator YciM
VPRNYRVSKSHTIIILSLIILFYTIGCSKQYTTIQGNKVLIPIENPKPKRAVENEDQLIIQALYLEEKRHYKHSSQLYSELYTKTQKDEYLLREAITAHHAGMVSRHLKDLEKYVNNNLDNFQAQRLLLSFYLKKKNLSKAKKLGSKLCKKSDQAADYELAANPYIFAGEYKESVRFLQEAYQKTFNEDILFKIITIKINYLYDVKGAIKDLMNHKTTQGCSEKICLQLINIYTQQRVMDKVIGVYKELYQKTQRTVYAEKIIEYYLLNEQIDSAIQYLENEQNNNSLLYALYMEKKAYKKANELTQYLLQKTLNPKWYAESAISFYESLNNKNDRVQLQKVVANFEKYLAATGEENPIYLNYYGYTLIDKDLDVPKGIEAVEKALEQEPENTYFLDSLAWGHYKLDNCEKAYPIMKKVVEVEGLNEEEIILHWNAINQKCKEQ